MKNHLFISVLAMFLACIGAISLVISFLPLINPGLGRVVPRHMTPNNYIGVAVSLLILAVSWYFNKKEQP